MLEGLSFQLLFDASSEALLVSNDAGVILEANPAAAQLFGYTVDELRGKSVEMLMPERFRAHHHQYRESYVNNPEKRPMGKGRELLALARDGTELQVDIGLSPMNVAGNRYVLMTFFDATLARQTQREIQETNERLRLAKSAAGLAVFDLDLHSQILHLDVQALGVLGLGLEVGEDKTYEKFLASIHPEDSETHRQALREAMTPEQQGQYQARFRIAPPGTGEWRWIVSTGRVIFDRQAPSRLIGVMQDVTDKIATELRLEEQRLKTESLVRRQIAGQTASAIAHELNQPLAAVSAYSEVAMRELDSIECTPRLRRALTGCVEQAHRAGQALHELLEFLRSGDVEVEEFDLGQTVKACIAEAQSSGLRRFKAELVLEPSLPHVLANETQVSKVLANLIRNGLESIESAGLPNPVITITVEPLVEEGMARVTVQDNGPGLESETAHRVFDPFFTTKSRGIGMGLAVSLSLIKANGGELWLDTAAPAGAVFHFTLPTTG